MLFDDLFSTPEVEAKARLGEGHSPRASPLDLVVSDRRAALDRVARVVTLRGGWVEAEGTPFEGLLLRSAEMWHLWRGGDRGGSGVSGSE